MNHIFTWCDVNPTRSPIASQSSAPGLVFPLENVLSRLARVSSPNREVLVDCLPAGVLLSRRDFGDLGEVGAADVDYRRRFFDADDGVFARGAFFGLFPSPVVTIPDFGDAGPHPPLLSSSNSPSNASPSPNISSFSLR